MLGEEHPSTLSSIISIGSLASTYNRFGTKVSKPDVVGIETAGSRVTSFYGLPSYCETQPGRHLPANGSHGSERCDGPLTEFGTVVTQPPTTDIARRLRLRWHDSRV